MSSQIRPTKIAIILQLIPNHAKKEYTETNQDSLVVAIMFAQLPLYSSGI